MRHSERGNYHVRRSGEANALIQGAVNNAASGDTIIVRDGAYNENVNVGVTHLTIQSENGSANCFVNASYR